MPKVSVIVPIYNSEKYLDNLITSLRNQTLKDIEFILVDDGSVDNSIAIMKKHENQDSRIHCFYQTAICGGQGKNTGIKKAKGDYILCLDSDDIFELDLVEKLYEKIKIQNADIAICSFKCSNLKTNRITSNKGLNFRKTQKCDFLSQENINTIFSITNIATWNKMYKRDFIIKNDIKYAETPILDDLKFAVLSLSLAKKIAFVHEDLLTYRLFSGTSQTNKTTQKILPSISVYKEIYYEFQKRNLLDFYNKYCINVFVDSIAGLLRFRLTKEILFEIKKLLKSEIFPFCAEKEFSSIFNIKKIKKQYLSYLILLFLTLGISSNIKEKYKIYKNIIDNLYEMETLK